MRNGFTLIELMIVVAIIAIIMAIALPNYSQYKKRVNRADVQGEMMNVAQRMESYKLANFKYPLADAVNPLYGSKAYPATGTALFTLTFSTLNNNTWVMTATPIATSPQVGDGTIILNDQGQKCWTKGTTCTPSASTNWDGK